MSIINLDGCEVAVGGRVERFYRKAGYVLELVETKRIISLYDREQLCSELTQLVNEIHRQFHFMMLSFFDPKTFDWDQVRAF